MINKIPTFRYEATCDKCRIKFEDECHGVIMWYDDSSSLNDALRCADWREIDNGIYCPDCYTLDEETDDLIVKTKTA
jgi:hypothetical protein